MARTADDETIELGFTGVGARGAGLARRCLTMEDVEIRAVCDVQDRRLDAVSERVTDEGRPAPNTYHDHQEMLAAEDLDGVVIATSWRFHLPMAIQALEAGVWPGLDVGPASSVEECWSLVDAAEASDARCMLLENGCFGRDRLSVLNMVRHGLFGEIVHVECGYCHDLRGRLNDVSGTSREDSARELSGGRYFRGIQHEKRNCDLYPTHGVGPLATCLDINRGNRFLSLTSTASKARGLADWGERHLPEDHPSRGLDWRHGDIITTVIRCANGETMTVTHDVSLPRPDNSKRFMVRGTRGMWQEEQDAVYIDEQSPDHEWEDFADYRDEYEHSLWDAYQETGVRGGHGGADYLVLRGFVEAIKQDVRPPIDVYDTAAWRAVSPLSEESIAQGSEPVAFPDFTNGRWMTDEPIFDPPAAADDDRVSFDSLLEGE